MGNKKNRHSRPQEEALGKIGYFESINVWAREEEITGYALCVEESSASIIGGFTIQ